MSLAAIWRANRSNLMPIPHRAFLPSLVLLAVPLLSGCARGEPEADPAAVDATLNRLVADDEARRQQLLAEARAREAAREREMARNEQNYAATPD